MVRGGFDLPSVGTPRRLRCFYVKSTNVAFNTKPSRKKYIAMQDENGGRALTSIPGRHRPAASNVYARTRIESSTHPMCPLCHARETCLFRRFI